jgi:hypothetical protein
VSTKKTLKNYAAHLRGMSHGKGMKGLCRVQVNACAAGARAIEAGLEITCFECGEPELIHAKDCPYRPKENRSG